jgi:hypothetical protein
LAEVKRLLASFGPLAAGASPLRELDPKRRGRCRASSSAADRIASSRDRVPTVWSSLMAEVRPRSNGVLFHRNAVSTAVEVDLRPASDDIGEGHALDADTGK